MMDKPLRHVSCPALVVRITDSDVRGDLMADELRDELLALYLSAHAVHVVLDFQEVNYLSSAGFRPLLRLNRQVREKGGRLVLCGLSRGVEEVFAITRLISNNRLIPATFEVQPSVPAAVASLYHSDSAQPAPGQS
jgi:anti-anti-sigma factor